MTKKRNCFDTNQVSLAFDGPFEAYARLKDNIINAPQSHSPIESYDEACIELAAVLKSTIRDSGYSREQIVDRVNEYFGWSTKDKRKCLTIAMLNNYLSKPTQYAIPAVGIMAIQHICSSLKPIGFMADLEGGKVITRQEVRELNLGKLEKTVREIMKMKKDLMKGAR